MTDTDSRINPADEREFEDAVRGVNGTAGDTSSAAEGGPSGSAVPELPNRFLAALIDGVVAGVIGFVPLVGALVGAAYLVSRDGLDFEFAPKRSIGKKIMKLQPVRIDGQPMDIATSVKRNWMFGLGALLQFLLFIPILGWLLMIPVGLAAMGLGLMELFKTLTDPDQRRFGDHWAGTRVIPE